MLCFRPDIGDEDGLAVAADGIFEEVGELALSVGDMVAFLIAGRNDYLLEEGERTVDVRCFFQGEAFSVGLLDAFVTGQVD